MYFGGRGGGGREGGRERERGRVKFAIYPY